MPGSRPTRVPAWAGLMVAVLAVGVAGCGAEVAPPAAVARPESAAASSAGSPAAAPYSAPAAPHRTAARPTRPAPPLATAPARRPVVVLDPGHDGGNAAAPAEINRQVDAGNGTRKACNTVGTSTAAGYPEHAFAWDVVLRTRALLRARGVDVRLTRPDDAGVGPCVDVRGRYGNAMRADAVVSVHADGAPAGGTGFHLVEAARAPGGAAVAASGHRLALALRSALETGSGLSYADYVAGGDALDVRDDLAGLNLSTRPTVLAELGNMRSPRDAALLSAPTGRQRIAAALATGIAAFLGLPPR